jgi:hypothetical protein
MLQLLLPAVATGSLRDVAVAAVADAAAACVPSVLPASHGACNSSSLGGVDGQSGSWSSEVECVTE